MFKLLVNNIFILDLGVIDLLQQVIRQVSCGAVHVVALSEEGLLQAWGNSLFLSGIIFGRTSQFFFAQLTIRKQLLSLYEKMPLEL